MYQDNSFFHKIGFDCIILTIFLLASCAKFVDVGAPTTKIGVKEAYQSDATATSAIVGLYNNSYIGYLTIYFTGLLGCSADDIKYATASTSYLEFTNNAITSGNPNNANYLWADTYSEILQSNLAITNLNASNALTPAVKNQLLGEAKTWRAFMYFYLVNMYGNVPLELTTDNDINGHMSRTSSDSVWAQIITDLKDAVNLLSPDYPTAQRARINKYTAMALLAKAYLYTKDWKDAAQTAGDIINSGIYSLSADLNTSFNNTSNEIIWQIATTTGISVFGSNFLAPKGSLPAYIMYDTLYHSFEANDLRKQDWTMSDTIGSTPYYYVYKYKDRAGTGNEYNVVFRLAEQYFIRAEARAEQNEIADAVSDINVIRNRAGLSSISDNISRDSALMAVEQQRKFELFGEWGNRWFDLKRTPSVSGTSGLTRADDILSIMKSTWKHTSVFYPIPASQITINTQLTQNDGY
ncbi:MAG: RagB/SusD family nutrient uptake outer membrane protein [Chitinophagaceae bacterium]|nr:RagB/SusD family nutrient uptake outer membrane protein [Chitinophagaceae bacterium]